MGSGSLIKRAIKKYGVNNFERHILHIFETREEALRIEASLVNLNVINDPWCYNLAPGGGIPYHNAGCKTKALNMIGLYYSTKDIFDKDFEYEVTLQFQVKAIIPDTCGPLRREFWKIITGSDFLLMLSSLYNSKKSNTLANKYLTLLETIPAFQNNLTVNKYPKTTLVKNSYA